MAGTVVSVIPSRLLDFSSLAMGSSMELVLKQSIDVTAWMAASLLVRVSTVDLSGGDIFITAYLEGLTPDDPGAQFIMPVEGEGPIGVSIDGSTVAPAFVVTSLGGGLGSALRVVAQAFRTASTGNVAATFSVDVCLKNGF